MLSTICGLDDYFGRTGRIGHDYGRMTYMTTALTRPRRPLAAE